MVNIDVGALLIFVGAQRTIVSAHLSIVGAGTPTKVYKLTPMDKQLLLHPELPPVIVSKSSQLTNPD